MGHGIDDLTGKKFGRLTVVEYIGRDERYHHYWKCMCECGNREPVVTRSYNLVHGVASACKLCSNLKRSKSKTKHGLTNDPLYSRWLNMRRRCSDENHEHYNHYGGKGVSVCEEWADFNNFYNWAINSGYEPGLTIDREDVNGDYCPDNCRWADTVTQANNKSTNRLISYGGVTKTVAQWARIFNIPYETLRKRIKRLDMRDFKEYFGE